MLDVNQLAIDIKNALGFSTLPVSVKNQKLATAIITHIQTGIVVNAIGTVTGIAPPSGGPLTNGAAVGGLITGLVPTELETALVSAFGASTPQILGMADAISAHITSTGLVNFAIGNITGTCANTPISSGPLVGQGTNGTVTLGSGSILATALASALGQSSISSSLLAMCNAIVNHINNNAQVTYALGTITGTCSAGGGPVLAGTGIGGTIL